MGTDHQEIEWQYEAPYGLEKVEEWLGGQKGGSERSGLTVLGCSSKELVDTYYDTGDQRLYRAGHALRIRREGWGGKYEATMKSPFSVSGAAGNLRRWREISEPLKSGGIDALLEAPGPVGERLRALVGPREVRPIFEVRTRRQTFDLVLDSQVADQEKASPGSFVDVLRVGEISLDLSEILTVTGGESVRLARVEVEVDASATKIAPELESFVKAMEKVLGLRPAATSKYEAGLFATGQGPDDEANTDTEAGDGTL